MKIIIIFIINHHPNHPHDDHQDDKECRPTTDVSKAPLGKCKLGIFSIQMKTDISSKKIYYFDLF